MFLEELFAIEELGFLGSLMPEEEVVGRPTLVVFLDGSLEAFGTAAHIGAAAYIRWELRDGSFWTRLIMGRSKIARKGMSSISRIELDGAVVGHRLRVFLTERHGLDFEKTWNLVSSATVLGYLAKEGGGFEPFEDVRIGEVQAGGELGGEEELPGGRGCRGF